jgi:hypothetical protein
VKGPSQSIASRIRIVAIFAVAFISGAAVIFGMASLVGAAFQAAGLSLAWRVGFAAAGLIALAWVDLLALRKKGYCPLGMRRQTPKSLIYRYPAMMVVAVWGFDTGLAVTTFRVAAITWGALVLAGLGLSAWWIGLGYGFGFVLPLLISILTQPSDRSREQSSVAPIAPRLGGLLRKRSILQSGSAVILLLAGTVLLIRLFV